MILITEITQLFAWYEKNSPLAGVNKLLDFQDKIAIRSYTLASELAEMKKEYNLTYFHRKIEFNKAKSNYIQKRKYKISEADTEAILDVQNIQEKEIEYESAGYRMEILLRQINRILQAIQQRISFLKFEMNQTNSQNQT